MFTDGYSDLDPSCFGPVWSMLDHTTVISKPMEDSLNKAYCNFIYLPSQFSHLNQNHQALMTELTCSDHHNTVLKDKLSALISRKGLNTEHISSLVNPYPSTFCCMVLGTIIFQKCPGQMPLRGAQCLVVACYSV